MKTRQRKRIQWRKFEYTMFIPQEPWDTPKAQRFVDFYADAMGAQRKPIVFDLASKGRGSRYLGMFHDDRISLSLELDTDERWRTLIHELAHYWTQGRCAVHGKIFLEAMRMTHKMFRQWLILERESTQQ